VEQLGVPAQLLCRLSALPEAAGPSDHQVLSLAFQAGHQQRRIHSSSDVNLRRARMGVLGSSLAG
jgi:hypothetical protein